MECSSQQLAKPLSNFQAKTSWEIPNISITIEIDTTNTIARLDEILRAVDASQDIIEYDADEMVNEIVLRARGNAPWRTGNLAESIHAEGSFPSYAIVADAQNEYGQYYASFVEYGTSLQEVQPFLWPAVHEVIAEYRHKFSEDFRKAIRGV